MPFREYNCELSTAVRRIAFNKHKNELIIEYYPTNESPAKVYHYTRLRLSRENIEAVLTSLTHSLGEFINTQVKPNSRFKQIRNFPRNIRPIRRNYSGAWIECIKAESVTKTYLESLLIEITRCDPMYPPSIPPPQNQDSQFFEEMKGEAGTSQPNRNNPFAELDSGDELSDIEDNPVSQEQTFPQISFQARYVHGHVVCRISEVLRNNAIEYERDKDLPNSSHYWSESYNTLASFCDSHVAIWAAAFYQSVSEDINNLDEFDIDDYFANPTNARIILDSHDIRQLYEFLNGYEILLEDTERHKDNSLNRLKKREEFLRNKLYPMWNERNEVRDKIGVTTWKSNPHPKLDYAERRRRWEEELRDISQGISVLEQLNFTGLKTFRH